MMSERAVLPDIGKLDQDPMSQVGYPTGVVGFHGLFGCKPLGWSSEDLNLENTHALSLFGIFLKSRYRQIC